MKEVTVFLCFVVETLALGSHLVSSPTGKIRGSIDNVAFDGKRYQVRKYLGIPYAEAPVGILRFMKPVPKKPFKSTYEATKLKAICTQAHEGTLPRDDTKEAEDCLFLNIYAPYSKQETMKEKCVLVYLHGGYGRQNFVNGGSNFVAGDLLSVVGDVIVVTLNYRLSLLGFFSMEDNSARGNFGLWDQHLALAWVHRNIAAFGGDPEKVTLFGNGQGAVSAILQAFYPGNAKYFDRLIAHKGTPFRTLRDGLSPHITQTYPVVRTVEKLGCTNEQLELRIHCMRNISISSIKAFVASETDNEAINPSIDNEFILAAPENLVEDGEAIGGFSGKDLLVGFDCAVDTITLDTDMTENRISYIMKEQKNGFESYIHNRMLQIYGFGMPNFTENIIANRYMDTDGLKGSEQDLMATFDSDTTVLMPSLRTYASQRRLDETSKTFLYEIHTTNNLRSEDRNKLADETAKMTVDDSFYIFGFAAEMLAANNMSSFPISQEDLQLSEMFINFLVTFAKEGKLVWKGEDILIGQNISDVSSLPCVQLPAGIVRDYSEHPSVQFWLDIVPRLNSLILTHPKYTVSGEMFHPPDNDDGEPEKDISKEGANAVIIALGVITGLLCLCLLAMAAFVVFVKIRRTTTEARR